MEMDRVSLSDIEQEHPGNSFKLYSPFYPVLADFCPMLNLNS